MYKKLLNLLIIFSIVLSSNAYAKDYAKKFYDVDRTHWAFEYISEFADRNIISGYSDGSFQPSKAVSRAEWAKLICNISGKQPRPDEEPYAVDYNSSDWFCGYVNAVADYMNFYEANGKRYFQGSLAISREDVTVSLVKIKGIDVSNADLSYVNSFTDSNSISNSAKKYVAVAVEKGLITGYESNTFHGQDSLSRAEAAAILSRAEKISEPVKYDSENCYPNTIIPSYEKITGKSVISADVMEGLVIYMYGYETIDEPLAYLDELLAQDWAFSDHIVNEETNIVTEVFTKDGIEVDMTIYFDSDQVIVYFTGDKSNIENASSSNNTQTLSVQKYNCYPNTIIPSYEKITGKSAVSADVMEGLVIYMYDCRTNEEPQAYMQELWDQGWTLSDQIVNEETNIITVVFTKDEIEVNMTIYFSSYQVIVYFPGDKSNIENVSSSNSTQTPSAQKRKVTCSECNGQKYVTCSTCHGKGTMRKYNVFTHKYEESTCISPECQNGKRMCVNCNGMGYRMVQN